MKPSRLNRFLRRGGEGAKTAAGGFTLIEVLIVVVIIAVLATLILPRFLGQTENAIIGEAQQMLGAMRRAQQNRMSLIGSEEGVDVASCGNGVCPETNAVTWSAIGLTPPLAAHYNFQCGATAGFCSAIRVGVGAKNPPQLIALWYADRTPDHSEGEWACAFGYERRPGNKGCCVGDHSDIGVHHG